MKTIKTILTMLVALFTLAAYGQSGFPPKSYPASIKVITDPGVAQYWDVNRIMYTGPGNGGHKFRIYGKAAADSRAMNINMFYILPGNMLKPAGAYFFPAIKKGEPFNFEIVSAFTGHAPKSFQGFLIMDEMLPAPQTPPASASVPEPPVPPAPTSIELIPDSKDELEIRASDLEEEYDGPESTPAEFFGGQAALNKWVAENLRYPEAAKQNNIKGRVIVLFVIDEEGNVTNPTIKKGVDRDLDREAVRVVMKMPKWKPATQKGKPVRSEMIVPINFNIR